MKIKKQSHTNHNKYLYTSALGISLLLIVALYFVFIYKTPSTTQNNGDQINSIDYNKPSQTQIENGASIKGNNVDNDTTTLIPGTNKSNVQLTITALNQTESNLQIRSQIDAVENNGQCTLLLSRTGHADITKTSTTQALASTMTCKGFDVPLSELSTGKWTALVTYDSSLLTGSATKDIAIE